MSESAIKIIPLTEYETEHFPRGDFSNAIGEMLWRDYRGQVAVDFPSPKTDGQWQLTSQGWVGYIPVTPELGISLQPKVELKNIFGMLEYAYGLEIKVEKELWDCKSLEEVYERLAHILALKVLSRGRKGFYRAYIPRNENPGFIRGRMDLLQTIRRPWDVRIRCHFKEHTPDIAENQILSWTLSRIARGGVCTERVLPVVRRAYMALQGSVSREPHSAQDCIGRLYNRLNEDYEQLHALCWFFLEQSGPTHEVGDRKMVPFLINIPRLYELFVAEWLRLKLPSRFKVKAQETVPVGTGQAIRFNIDLVLYDAMTDEALFVLDTKYKKSPTPSPEDVAQVVAYAEAKKCHDAVLIYPSTLTESLDVVVGDNRVRSLSFSIDGDLDEAGSKFIENLFMI